MKQVRFGVFETNSSSTHSLTIVSENDFEKWKNGELVLDHYEDKLVSIPEDFDENGDEFQTYGQWEDCDFLEYYIRRFTTDSGDKIVAFGQYGMNN